MVTRYTIDQILSRGSSSSPPATPTPSPTLLSSTSHSPLWRPTPLTNGALETSHHLTANRRYNEPHHRDARTDSLTTDDEEETHKGRDSRAEDVHRLACPVPLRPQINLPLCDTPALEAFGLRPDLSYAGLEGGVYGLMLRQYMEAHYHLGGPRSLLPLSFQGYDSAVSSIPTGLVNSVGSGRTRRRGGQVRFTAQQTRQLETWFARHKYITPAQRKTIARELTLHEKQVKTWFQNRRAKWRKVQAQRNEEQRNEELVC
ncbi:Hematopoietically-expressed homeobox protein HHEX [Portunus trituberculatus]|uniref:Hematopoietically-expressed homeobox protein HHEX n=1 Tax=Portunus trituberculatus TaxID=210409 RepID=A0A5B7DP45_PORTR|nr:Hematopoietically-expressed homeobox protein HHEX [Portunus trituberculatus]